MTKYTAKLHKIKKTVKEDKVEQYILVFTGTMGDVNTFKLIFDVLDIDSVKNALNLNSTNPPAPLESYINQTIEIEFSNDQTSLQDFEKGAKE